MDAVIIPWLVENPYTVMLALAALKILATATPWAEDDEIVQMLTSWTKTFTNK